MSDRLTCACANLPSWVVGMGVSVAVGIFFGLWPAMQAARVNPIEALRSD
jgi:putative ABC transport system permease protein